MGQAGARERPCRLPDEASDAKILGVVAAPDDDDNPSDPCV